MPYSDCERSVLSRKSLINCSRRAACSLTPLTITNSSDGPNPALPLKLQAKSPSILASAVPGRLSTDNMINSRLSHLPTQRELRTKNTSAPRWASQPV